MTNFTQFFKNVKNYENHQGFINQNTYDRLHVFKKMYPGMRLSNIKKNVAARIIQEKFHTTRNWSNYLSLNKVPEGINLMKYSKQLMTGYPSLSEDKKHVRLARIIPVFIKMYTKDPSNKLYIAILDRIKHLEKHVTNNDTYKKLKNLRNKTAAIKQRHIAATKIQKRYRLHKFLPRTNENFIKAVTRTHFKRDQLQNLVKLSKRKYETNNLNNALNRIYKKRHMSPSFQKATNVIERATHRYQTQRLEKITRLLDDMKRDGRFDYYVSTLTNLVKRILKVLDVINRQGKPHERITGAIGPCHIKPNEVPKKYLANMYNQLVYVSKGYQSVDHKKFFNRLDSMLGGRPCLENMMDAMINSLLEPVFEWTGKNIDPPLVQNNDRYLTNVLAKAVSSWVNKLSNENKSKLPNNLEKRKNMFWNMIKGRNLHVRNKNGIPVYSTPAKYNKYGGKKFKESNLANTLEYL